MNLSWKRNKREIKSLLYFKFGLLIPKILTKKGEEMSILRSSLKQKFIDYILRDKSVFLLMKSSQIAFHFICNILVLLISKMKEK